MTDTNPRTTPDAIVTDPGAMIEIKGLNKWLKGGEAVGVLHVLRDIDLTVARREKCGNLSHSSHVIDLPPFQTNA